MAENKELGFRNPWIWIVTILLIVLVSWAIGITYSSRVNGTGLFTDSTPIHNGYNANNTMLYRTPENTGGMLR